MESQITQMLYLLPVFAGILASCLIFEHNKLDAIGRP